MADRSQHRDDDVPLMPFSCYQCRNRKLKCDRFKPECTRCGSSGEKCQYPASRKRPVIMATRPKVQDLEARLAMLNDLVDLEYRLKKSQAWESQTSGSPAPSLEGGLIATGRFEQLPPPAMIEQLTNIYFTSLHPQAPMLHQSTYLASLYLPPHMQPPMCLQYAVMAEAAVLSPTHSHLAQAFYRRARSYLEADEMRDEGQYFITLAHCQCWVLLGHFEVQNLWFSRASMSTSRSVRLAQILGLNNIDGDGGLGTTIAPPKDWCEKEERRRTMWAVFCNDRNTSSTTGWPSLMDAARMKTLLPASEEAFHFGIEEPSVGLADLTNHTATKLSAFACRVLAVHLFHECLDHTYRDHPDPNPEDVYNSVFWQRHQDLNNGIATAFITLPDELRCPANTHNHGAVLINLQLHTALICLHRIGAARAKKQDVQLEILASTQARLIPAAEQIFAIVACLGDVNAMFKNPFVAFSAYMAAFVFLEDFKDTQNRDNEGKMGALLDLMIVIGRHNLVTASLAVQMAHELRRTRIDPSAIDKVQDLMANMAKSPFMAKQNDSVGSIVFCPFELPSGAAPEGVPAAYPTSAPGWF
ncbi:Fc.00g012420.m01.CDS01 [Cosmosporella sp. VM-42]